MSGKQRKTGSDRLQERAQALIERGLTSYRRDEVEAAVIDWRHALALDPHADRAREYIEHALAHKDIDHVDGEIGVPGQPGEPGQPDQPDQIDEGQAASAPDTHPDAGRDDVAAEAAPPAPHRSPARTPTSPALPRVLRKTFEGPPMPAEHFAGQGDGSATQRMTLADAEAAVQPFEPQDTQPVAVPRGSAMVDTLPPMHAFIEEMPTEDTEPLNRPPPGLVQDEPPVSLAPTVELRRAEMEQIAAAVPEKAHIRTLARTELDAFETYEIHLARPDAVARADRHRRSGLPPVVIEDVEEGEEETPQPKGPAGHADPTRPRTQTAQLYGALQVPSRPPAGLAGTVNKVSVTVPSAWPAFDEPPAPETSEPPEPPEVPDAPDADDEPAGPTDPVARMLLERLNAEKPGRRGDEEARKDRVLWLIDYAQSEYIGGDYQTAVTALDLALDEASDSDSVQAIIEERANSLIEIYASYEGDPSAVPSLAMTASEYGRRALDSHAAFLLSRVDGMLTIDDLMTVAGMPTLEAHRHLCNLLRQGILTLR